MEYLLGPGRKIGAQFVSIGTMQGMGTSLINLEELQKEARIFAQNLRPQTDGATLVTLSGELGAGKTTFVQEIAKTLGVNEVVTSPTFVLQKSYMLKNQPFERLVHIDAYRLEEGEHLTALSFDELLKDSKTLMLLEWPEHVGNALPASTVCISLTVTENNARTISYG